MKITTCSRAWIFIGAAMLTTTASADAGQKLTTVSYDVSDIVAKRGFVEFGGQPLPVTEGLVRNLLLEHLPELAQRLLKKDSPERLRLLNGNKLEVHTDAKTHEHVRYLLSRCLLDVRVVVKSWLFEVDKKTYEQQIRGKLNRLPGEPAIFADPATREFEMKWLNGELAETKPFYKGLKPLQSSKVTLQDRRQGEIFSRRTAVAYEKSPGPIFEKKEIAVAFPGFAFSMTPTVSPDRNKTHIELTQKVTSLLAWKKETADMFLPSVNRTKEVVFDVPVLQEATFTSRLTVFNGWPIVAAVAWSEPNAKDRVLVLLFSAGIFIGEEDRMIGVWTAVASANRLMRSTGLMRTAIRR